MLARLKLHPDSPPPPVSSIEAEAERVGSMLRLRYRLVGDLAGLRIPEPAAPARKDELWRRTCFEAFVRSEGADAYAELNIAPSREWAAYRFDGYRSGMGNLDICPLVQVHCDAEHVQLEAEVELAQLPALTWSLGLSAVVEAADGSISYWALRHPPGEPDFHHRDCFALTLAPAA